MVTKLKELFGFYKPYKFVNNNSSDQEATAYIAGHSLFNCHMEENFIIGKIKIESDNEKNLANGFSVWPTQNPMKVNLSTIISFQLAPKSNTTFYLYPKLPFIKRLKNLFK